MQRKLFGIVKRRKEQKEKRERERANDIARKRAAISAMQESHRKVKEWEYIGTVKASTGVMVNITLDICKVALFALPIVVTVALTIKVTLFILSLF